MIQVYVLGQFSVLEGESEPVAPPRLVSRVGTLLAGWPGQWVERERMLHELWGERPPRTALNTLQAHISQLRRVVGRDFVVGDSSGYLLDIDPSQVDAEVFEELVHEAARAQRQMHLGRARQLLSEALDLWRGTPYRDIQDSELLARRERLEELHRNAQENYLECQLLLAKDSHQLDDTIARAKALVSLEPLREKRRLLLIHALRNANRHAEAASALNEAVKSIKALTGAELGPEIRQAVEDSTSAMAPWPRFRTELRARETPPIADESIEQLRAEIFEALVVQNVPVLIACAPTDLHENLAETMAQELFDDFPAGIEVVPGEHIESNDDPPRHGLLRILVGVSTGDIATLIAGDRRPEGAILIVASKPPMQQIRFPVLLADTFEGVPPSKAS